MFKASTRSFAIALALVAAPAAQAQSPEEFYKGKTLNLIVSSTPGGGYDSIARIVAQHLQAHMPGRPAIAVQNMPGAAGLRAANTIYTVTERNGLNVGVLQLTTPFEPLIGNKNATFDATKFSWIGAPNVESGVLVIWNSAPALSVNDLRQKEILVGVENMTSSPAVYARALAYALDLKFKLVSGYQGSAAVMIAMEKEEVHAFPQFHASLMANRPEWLRDKKATIAVRWGPKVPGSPANEPYAEDIVGDPRKAAVLKAVSATLALGRPFAAPPGVPADRLAALRKAFADTFRDPAFVTDATRAGFVITPQSGEQLAQLIDDVYASPKEIFETLKYVFTGE